MNEPVILIGAGGHAKVVADILHAQGREVIGVLDDRLHANLGSIPWLGTILDARKFASRAVFIITIGSIPVRKEICAKYAGLLRFTTAIHPGAIVANDVLVGTGTVVMAGAVINSSASIGKHCIINTSSSVDHDSIIEDLVHIAPGAHLAGGVFIGNNSFVGIGSAVIQNMSICSDCLLGAGAVVTMNICVPGKYVGVPARRI